MGGKVRSHGGKKVGGAGASDYAQSVYGGPDAQRAGPNGAIAMNQVGGGDLEGASIGASGLPYSNFSATGGRRRRKKGKGGIGLMEAGVPALLLYANNALGRGRKSVRLNPMSHFSKGKRRSSRKFSRRRR